METLYLKTMERIGQAIGWAILVGLPLYLLVEAPPLVRAFMAFAFVLTLVTRRD